MAVNVQCPGCFSGASVPQEKLGGKVKCRTCGQVFVAKGGESSASAKGTRSGGKGSSGRSKKSKSGSSNPLGLLTVIGAVVVLGIGAYAYFGRGGEGAVPVAPGAPVQASAATQGAATPTAGTSVAASSAAPVPAGAVWNVVDPPKEPLEWTRTLDVQIALPAGETKRTIPELLGPFLATSNNNGFTVLDLRSTAPVKHVDFPAKRTYGTSALSPNGQHFATSGFEIPKSAPGAGRPDPSTFPPSRIQIVSVATGAVVADVDTPLGIPMVQWMEFRSPTELVAMGITKEQKWAAAVLGLDGKVLRSLPVPVIFDEPRLTPGGKYLLVLGTFGMPPHPLVAIDLDSGQLLGSAATHDDVYRPLSLTDMAFSADGRQVAILQRYDDAFRVLVLSAADGKKIRQITIPGDSKEILSKRTSGPKGLEWHPDGKHLVLFDGLVVDAESGKVATDMGNVRETTSDAYALGYALIAVETVYKNTIRSSVIQIPPEPSPPTQ